ncbi:hypothetical protein C8J57DRAFT_236282 [Mycena rebaudengoi]|nr:hypothetical protein C8J57DRAFT_236282 [Mycena rebaudengoi]
MPFVDHFRPRNICGRLSSTPRMPDNAQDNLQLLQLVADSRLTGYLAVASICVLIYDHIVCFPDEVELMWKSRWRFAKIIYLFNRYFSLISICLNTTVILREITTSSVRWLKVQGSTSTVVIATVDLVLMVRVWILYGRRRWLVWLFIFMGIAEVVIMIVVDLFAYAEMTAYVRLGSLIKGCYAYNVPRFLTLYAAAPLLVTLIMFLLTLYKCGVTLHGNAHRVMPIWKLFLRDGVVWFLAVFAAGGSELIIWTSKRETLKQILVVPALVVYSTVASRAILNIKKIMSSESESDGITLSYPDPIVFAPV